MNRLALILLAGILIHVSWENGWLAPTQIQYATTPTSTWKTLGVAPAGDNTFDAPAASNTITRGRFYYFRARHTLDNGTVTSWSKTWGAVWLTGGFPTEGMQAMSKDNSVVKLP